ncbi:MAG: DnaQ exonuclease/DinG helicase family protein, ATP-dependent DNA helicase DinG [Candidatus Peregrinibacteria bacterium GW2011_GWE2_39_6]|nr:MAG: DnaQ exonuclease/DinG helicase family protein, ATP-dependent DNA helicase DinG [Candidatus Peregrinibacteria bacterium GW2011_GWF2_39_17]KKR26304.1 MAG: DnaQ exonuclease/DinG helicase family protein, ATP-dependent DNA helicase DinG [Candidatus Peregrinibacteria bacterium GW2011_GWE2_39_6]HCW32676.1 hypothetical protein [Candidatus Peregrinibacteria bacterium]
MYLALDLETTGLDPTNDKIIEIALIKFKPDGTIVDEFQSLFNPQIPIPPFIQNLTKISNDNVQNAPLFQELANQIQNFIGDLPILGHSVKFDISFLQANGLTLPNQILDTFHLAQTLLPDEKSYSLEILSEKYGLTHESKHRALDDTRVTIELYQLLLQKIREIPFQNIAAIKQIIYKSNWAWKDTFLTHLPSKKFKIREKEKNNLTTTSHHLAFKNSVFQTTLKNQLSSGMDALIENSAYSLEEILPTLADFCEQSGEKYLIATPNPDKIHPDPRLAKLSHPDCYLCPYRFQNFLTKPFFQDSETRFLIKIIIWKSCTSTGERIEISLGEEEYATWDQVSALNHLYETTCNDKNCFYQKAFEQAIKKPILVVHPYLLIQSSIREKPLIPTHHRLIIDAIEEFETQATNALTIHFSLESFTGLASNFQSTQEESPNFFNFEILFGLLGIFLEKYADNEEYFRRLILNQSHYQTIEWQKIKGVLQNIETKLHALNSENENLAILKAKFSNLEKCLTLNSHLLTWITLNSRQMPIISSCSTQIGKLLAQELWPKYHPFIGLSHYGSLNHNLEFLKQRLHLNKDLPELLLEPKSETSPISTPPFKLIIHPHLPNIYSPSNQTETINIIKDTLQSNLSCNSNFNHSFLLTNSKTAIEHLYESLVKILQPLKINALAEGISGGQGKIAQLFKNTSSTTLLIGTEKFYHAILDQKAASTLTLLFIHRLPFLPISHPVHQLECRNFTNDFTQYTLPLAILRLKRFIYEFNTACSPQKIQILDPRIENYNGLFLESFPSHLKPVAG